MRERERDREKERERESERKKLEEEKVVYPKLFPKDTKLLPSISLHKSE